MSFVEKPLPKVPLEYGTSVDDLERQVNKYVRGSRQAEIEQLFNYAEELHVKLRAEREIKNEEAEYIYSCSFLEIILELCERDNCALNRDESPTQEMLLETLVSIEKLKKSLIKRYRKRSNRIKAQNKDLYENYRISTLKPVANQTTVRFTTVTKY